MICSSSMMTSPTLVGRGGGGREETLGLGRGPRWRQRRTHATFSGPKAAAAALPQRSKLCQAGSRAGAAHGLHRRTCGRRSHSNR